MAIACLLLILLGSTAQAAHVHGKLLPENIAQMSSDAGPSHIVSEDLCPLCAAMHSALAAPALPALRLALERPPHRPAVFRLAYSQAWSFKLFSRPPPSLL